MTYKDDMAKADAYKKKVQAKYGKQALARLEKLSRRDGVDYMDMPEKDFKQVAKKPAVDKQAAQYQDGRLKARLDALSSVAGVDLSSLSLDDFNGVMQWLGPAITDAANRHKAANENSNKNRNPFA